MFFVPLTNGNKILSLIETPAARYFEAGLKRPFLCTGEKEIYDAAYNSFKDWYMDLKTNPLFLQIYSAQNFVAATATATLFGNIAVLNSRVKNHQVDSDKELRKAAAWQANILSSWLFPLIKNLRGLLTSKKEIEEFDTDFFYAFKSWQEGFYYKSTISYLIDISNIGEVKKHNYSKWLAILEAYEDTDRYWDSYVIDKAFEKVFGDCKIDVSLLANKIISYDDVRANPFSQFVTHMNSNNFWGEIYTGDFDSYFFENISEFTILLFTLTPKELYNLYEQYSYGNNSFYSGSDCYPSDYPPDGSLSRANKYTVDLGFSIFGVNCNEDF